MAQTASRPVPNAPPGLRHPAVLAGVLVAVTFLAYFSSLAGELIWNDPQYVTRPALRSLAGLGRIWTEPGATEQYYPLLHSSFWLQCRLWGENPLGYHLVTIALHAGSAVLFALVLRRLGVPGAWLAAFLFALHPVHAESVAWITEQKNTLSLVLYLGAALLYLRFDETRSRRAYGAALGLFVLSLLCKTVTATLPAALLVIFWWRRNRLDLRRDVRPLLPWFAAGAAMGLFTSWIERHYVGAQGDNFSLTLAERILIAGRALWFYLGQIVWPVRLNFVYPRWTPDAGVLWQWLFPLGALALAAGLWGLRRRSRAPLAAFLFFAGSAFPVLGFVNLYGSLYSWVWDHWQYLPDLGPLALLAAGATLGWQSLPARWRPFGPVAAAVLLLWSGLATWRHNKIFHDSVTLFRTTLALNPDCWMAHYNLGCLLAKTPSGVPEAIGHFQETLRLNPGYAGAYINLGVALADIPGHSAEALANLEAAARADPTNAKVWYNLGNLLAADPARGPEAIAHYEHALQLDPDYPEAHDNLGKLLAALPGREPEAMAHFKAAIALQPDLASAHNNLGNVLGNDPAQVHEAVAHLETAVRLAPDFPEAHYNLGNLLGRAPGRLAEAISHYEAALRLKPDYAQAEINLGIALAGSPDRKAEAVTHFAAAVRLEPQNPSAHLNLGIALAQIPGRLPDAISEMSRAVQLNPSSAEAHFSLGVLLWRSRRIGEAHAEFSAAVRIRPEWAEARRMSEQTRP